MTTDNASQETRQLNVGARLRKAREAAGLTVTEVADRQHLRPAVITAIEKGDYGQIDSELFLKGYVRAYASQVGVDPDSVVRQLDRELEPLREEQQAKVEANPLVTIERRKRRKRQIARIVAVLVVLAILFYGGSLYLARQQAAEPEAVTGPGEDVESPALDEGALDAEPDADEPPVSPEADTGGEQLDGPDEPGAGDETAEAAADSETGPGATPELAATGNEATGADDAAEPVSPSAAEEPEPDIVTTPLEEPEVSGNGQGRLVVEFSDDCWVEVQDANGRTLAAALRTEGQTLDVTGEAPLRVVLGAVNAVASVRYSGETVDLSDRRARNNRLVLTLPE